jgi:hypothetical protein
MSRRESATYASIGDSEIDANCSVEGGSLTDLQHRVTNGSGVSTSAESPTESISPQISLRPQS